MKHEDKNLKSMSKLIRDLVKEELEIQGEKFPDGALIIKYNGSKRERMEHIYVSLGNTCPWQETSSLLERDTRLKE